MMIKLIEPDAWNFDTPQLEIIKVASSGIGANDFRALVKRAGHPLAMWAKQQSFLPGDVPVHAITLGCTEKWGPNRNADGYSENMIRTCHPTFEKYAKFYRNHKNTDPSKSYGLIKKAWYNDELGRGEVIAVLNGTREAALRNGGLLADKEMEKLAREQPIDVSQSVKVPGDYCTGCNKFARNRAEYCTPKECVKYGGCRDNLGRVYDDGHHQFVRNESGTFFDLSNVSFTRGADRTAFITGKAAAVADTVEGGAELAEKLGLVAPEYLLDGNTLELLKIARELEAYQAKRAAAYVKSAISWNSIIEGRKAAALQLPSKKASAVERHNYLAELASAGVMLSPTLWLSACTGVDTAKCAAFWGDTQISPRIHLLDNPDLHDILYAARLPKVENMQKYAAYAPTVESEGRIAVRMQLIENNNKQKPIGREGDIKCAAARYVAYQCAVISTSGNNSSKSVLQYEDAIRNNLTNPS